MSARVAWLGLAALAACAGTAPTPTPATAQQAPTGDTTRLPPAGYGTLRQEEVAIRLETPTLALRVLPLDERVIRLLAPDTYGSLNRLRDSRAAQADSAAQRHGVERPAVFLVTFFGREPQARFDPELVSITSQNRFFRPLAILPLSPLWSGRQLSQRETATAIYVFDGTIEILDPLSLTYGTATSDAWVQVLRTLDRERASVFARAGRRN